MKNKNLVANAAISLEQAMEKINDNKSGLLFLVDQKNKLSGIISDGDVRRYLLKGGALVDKALNAANKNYIYAKDGVEREWLLKIFDQKIKYVPILGSENNLINIFSYADLHLESDLDLYYASKAPVRISFAGGGTDLTNYFYENDGEVLSATVGIYCHAVLRLRKDKNILINSMDLGCEIKFDSYEEMISTKNSDFKLIISALEVIKPSFGFELYIRSDFPLGSGLGGSSAVIAAILSCFNQTRNDFWTLYEMVELAYLAERYYLDATGGWQDQYASIFGGFNHIEFKKETNVVNSIRVRQELINELEMNLILCDTGKRHNSASVHDQMKDRMDKMQAKESMRELKNITKRMKDSIGKGDVKSIGFMLHRAWQLKKNVNSKVTDGWYDEIYEGARENGALGGKLLGAGNGGHFLFYVEPFDRSRVESYLKSKGMNIINFNFETHGAQSWCVRGK